MTMTGLKISKTLLAVMLTSAVATGSAYAENATMDKAQSGVESAGQKVDSSMNKDGNLMDGSTNSAEGKGAAGDHQPVPPDGGHERRTGPRPSRTLGVGAGGAPRRATRRRAGRRARHERQTWPRKRSRVR